MTTRTSVEDARSRMRMDSLHTKLLSESDFEEEAVTKYDSPMSVEDYVMSKGGKHAIERVLIANNGIAAVKAMRSIKRWAYEAFGTEKAIEFVVMATPEDMKANAEYIRMADKLVKVPGGSNNHNYANVKLIVEIAEQHHVDAVWAGWGHASENPKLPDALAAASSGKHKIIWIGPPASAMRALGDKIASTIIAQSADVPCIPWSGSNLTVKYSEQGMPDDIFTKACVKSAEEAVQAARQIGYPIMVKASEGGGGKGIRKVESEVNMASAFRQVEGEVPGSPIFLMQLAYNCRHLEVQLLADSWGNAIALLGRDCSIQRRHQKIIEEGPVVAAPPHVWREMERAAVRLAKEVGYVGAGTVEYLYNSKGEYFFLELNPRLQVEHPVTELITGVNLPAAQLQVAMGIPLHQIPQVRRFFRQNMHGVNRIDFDTCPTKNMAGHVIACRITAENPEQNFQPTSGMIQELNFRSTPDVWGYFSIGALGGVHEYADSQFGHLFAVGETREIARRNMVLALKELSIRGEIRTTVEYLHKILETEDYKKNKIDTAWLERILAIGVLSEKPAAQLAVVIGAIYKAFQLSEKSFKELLNAIENGRILKTHYTGIMEYNFSLIYENIKYQFKVIKTGQNSFGIFLIDWYCDVEFNPLTDGGIYITLGGRGYVAYGHDSHSGFRVIVNGQTCVFSKEYDPSELRTEMAGKLIRYLCNSGEHMTKGSPYAEMEVMKMCIPLFCPESGVIETLKPEGSILSAGDLVAGLKLDDPNKVKKATLFEGTLKEFEDKEVEKNCYVLMKEATDKLKRVLAGFKARPGDVKRNLNMLMNSLRDYRLPMFDFEEVLSVLVGRIPGSLHYTLTEVIKNYSKRNVSSRFYWESPVPFPALEVENAILEAFIDLSPEEKVSLQKSIEPIRSALGKYVEGSHGLAIHVLTQLLDTYLEVEEVFMKEVREDFALQELRASHKNDSSYVACLAIAHADLRSRNDLVIQILDVIITELQPLLPSFQSILTKLSLLQGSQYSNVIWKSRQLILKQRNELVDDRVTSVKTILLTAINAADSDRLSRLQSLVEQSQGISDILLDTCLSRNEKYPTKCAAAEVYIRRTYRMYNIFDLKIERSANRLSANWSFSQNHADSMLKLRRVDSFAEMKSTIYRRGLLFVFESWDQVKEQFEALITRIQTVESAEGNNTVIHIALQWIRNLPEDSTFSLNFYHYLKSIQSHLSLKKVRRVTFIVSNGSPDLSYFTYRESSDFSEDQIIRHVEPTMARQMELERLSNYSVSHFPTNSRIVHLFTTNPKDMSAFNSRLGKAAQYSGKRLFARVLIKKMDHYGIQNVEVSSSENDILVDAEYGFVQALHSLEFAIGSQPREYQFNHVFLNYLVEESASVKDVAQRMRKLLCLYEETMRRLHVSEVELRLRLRGSNGEPKSYRFICSNSSGYYLDVDPYIENSEYCFQYLGESKPLEEAIWHGKSIDTVYPLTTPFQFHRQIAHHNESVWAYDFLILIRQGLGRLWTESGKNPPKGVLHSKELILDSERNLIEVSRVAGSNTIGMIAWNITMHTPEYPKGRTIILIANDITFKAGSFGPEEDELFKKASELARKLKVPRLYFSANSGARIGLASELLHKFQVSWIDNDPAKGLDYLYLSEVDYKELSKSVLADQIIANGDTRFVIRDIVGKEFGIGVENLSGSGMIAGETSRAYDEVFTLSYVSGRTVGIGAYLLRLGQRIVQKIGQPILLTGFRALNKLLGKEVYTSNTQLGGTGIMYPNGVSHLVVQDDMEGVMECLKWLSYVPATFDSLNPIVPVEEVVDPVERPVKSVPYGNACDPRDFIAGIEMKDDWIPGIFDKNSFKETLSGWAQTIVCGRARLGGIPVGIISVETRTKERTILADPANPDSKEFVLPQAGQVWFPDSSFKTSQAIFDMNREGLPLFILANWRGFSGGMRDMFDEILKYGSYIVDGLREYRQPVFVYLVPHGELRGGAWVVLDSTINPSFMEMYADPTARGGILEPAGILDIKYRESEIKSTAHRLDETLRNLKKELSETKDAQTRSSLEQSIRNRERELLSSYHQVAMKFADLHDTPGRMLAVKSINGIVQAAECRSFFYWRLRRRLQILSLATEFSLTESQVESIISQHLASFSTSSNSSICNWIAANHTLLTTSLSSYKSSQNLSHLTSLLSSLSPSDKSHLLNSLKQEQ